MYGQDILCGISKGTFEIPHKISYPYIGRFDFYTEMKFYEFLDLRAHKCFWNAPCTIYLKAIALEMLMKEIAITPGNKSSQWLPNTPFASISECLVS